MNNTTLLLIGMVAWTTACQGEAVYADPDPNDTEGDDSGVRNDGNNFAAAATVSGNISVANNGATSVTTTAGVEGTGGSATSGVSGTGGAVGDAVSASGAELPGDEPDLDPNCAADVQACWDALPTPLFTEEKCRAMQYACRGFKEVCVTQFLPGEASASDQALCDAAAGDHEQTRHAYGVDVTGTHITCCWLELL